MIIAQTCRYCNVGTRSHLKKRILAQDVGGSGFQTAGILQYVEDLKSGSNTQIGPKDFFEMASNQSDSRGILTSYHNPPLTSDNGESTNFNCAYIGGVSIGFP